MVLIGEGSKEAGDHIEELTLRYVTNGHPPVHRMSAGSAELAKLSLNLFITLKISFANFVGDLADSAEAARKRSAPSDVVRDDKRKRIDKMHIARAIGADSRVGLKCLLPGYGFGGPCFPRDGRALASFAQQVSSFACPLEPEIAEAPSKANAGHARFQAQRLIAEADAALRRRDLRGATATKSVTIVFDDVTFKPRCAVPIVLESQKLVVAKLVRSLSDHRVVIRSDRADVLDAVRRDFGTLFTYWNGEEGGGELVEPEGDGTAYIFADDVLLPEEEGGQKVRVPNNTKLHAVASSGDLPDASTVHHGAITESEKRGEEYTSLRTAFN